ncbi:unnamed protein product [Kuraishia capsulata CBS 1993]|uniref:AB hydrolase-1 domain-containing protein n=1 Tax=Kuraishia capsulata CBS 1993 TaxID=1382522 RepID=W6MRI4_9ASCO|nr:uncharacterized protein KUCA_T00004959001 [Kuraishia capsulata CBS 1993]CDK28973.1 unnamed protein product [Kuraishia capsulata CBS 1993]
MMISIRAITRTHSNFKICLLRQFSSQIQTVPLEFDKYEPPLRDPSAPPIVFLHGLYGHKTNNRTASRKLAKILGNDVYCLDLRNHGISPHTKRHDYPAMAADVERFCEEHGLEKAIMMGHSMGAKCAMAVALRRPDLTSMLISIDNVPCRNDRAEREFMDFSEYAQILDYITTRTTPFAFTTIKQADDELAKYESNALVRKFLLSNIIRDQHVLQTHPNDPHALVLKSKIPLDTIYDHMVDIRGWPFSDDDTFEKRSLFIKADHSPFVSEEEIPMIKQHFPNYDFVSMNSGHWVVTEKPDEFVHVVSTWIKEGIDK